MLRMLHNSFQHRAFSITKYLFTLLIVISAIMIIEKKGTEKADNTAT